MILGVAIQNWCRRIRDFVYSIRFMGAVYRRIDWILDAVHVSTYGHWKSKMYETYRPQFKTRAHVVNSNKQPEPDPTDQQKQEQRAVTQSQNSVAAAAQQFAQPGPADKTHHSH